MSAGQDDVKNAISANRQLLEEVFARLSQQGAQAHEVTREYVGHQFERQYSLEELKEKTQQLLDSFKFEGIWHRERQITEPDDASYESAFSMDQANDASLSIAESTNTLFRNTKYNLVQQKMERFWRWLQTGGSLFWISGCVGSGKSTLLKFLAQEQRDLSNYKTNNDTGLKLEVLTHYFWRPGSPMQKNRRGFLCSLLHQLLTGHQARINYVLESYPSALYEKECVNWKVSDLQRIVDHFLREPGTKFILFIDGLDEIDNDDELFKILQMLKLGGESPQVRLCVSSRPEWIILQELKDYPTICLQDLTKKSMMRFSQSILIPVMTRRGWHSEEQADFCRRLVEKADGIFLWLVLTTRIIRRSILEKGDKESVEKRLDGLPKGLENILKDMWERMGEDFTSYRESAAAYFSIMLVGEHIWNNATILGCLGLPSPKFSPKRLFRFLLAADSDVIQSCLNEGDLCDSDIEGEASGATMTDLPQDDSINSLWSSWIQGKQDELRIRCMGLLVVTNHLGSEFYHEQDVALELEAMLSYSVDFVHRSAYDFFTKTEAGQSILSASCLSHSDCCFRVARAILLLPIQKWRQWRQERVEWSNAIDVALYAVAVGLDHDGGKIEEALAVVKLCQERNEMNNLGKDIFSPMAVHESLLKKVLLPYFISPSLATSVLRNIWESNKKGNENYFNKLSEPSLARSLIEAGASVNERAMQEPMEARFEVQAPKMVSFRSPFDEFLLAFWHRILDDQPRWMQAPQSLLKIERQLEVLEVFIDAQPNLSVQVAIALESCNNLTQPSQNYCSWPYPKKKKKKKVPSCHPKTSLS